MLSLCCLRPPRDAAALACVCATSAAAYRQGRWPRAVRVKRSGAVLEPVSGAFDVTVALGEDVQAAVDRCPPGGCVLLRPGRHEGPLVLGVGREVHVFGRGQATLRTTEGDVLTSASSNATVDGLSLKRMLSSDGDEGESAVILNSGKLRLQNCDIISVAGCGILADDDMEADLTVVRCKCVRAFFFGGGGGILEVCLNIVPNLLRVSMTLPRYHFRWVCSLHSDRLPFSTL